MSLSAKISIIMLLTVIILEFNIKAYNTDNSAIYCKTNDDKRIALTFDDGPHGKYTKQILEILDRYKIHATFFIIGQQAQKYPELVKEEIEAGHEIGNHTYNHKNLKKLSDNQLIDEIKCVEKTMNEICDYKIKLFRPPEGYYNSEKLKQAEEMDYSVILWSVDTRDWEHTSSERIADTVIKNTKSGDIILCHDFISGKSNTSKALEEFIPVMLERGYTFVTVSQLIDGD